MVTAIDAGLDDIGTLRVTITGFDEVTEPDNRVGRTIIGVYLVLIVHVAQAIQTLPKFNGGIAPEGNAPEIEWVIPITIANHTGQITVLWQPSFAIDGDEARDALLQLFDTDYVQEALTRHVRLFMHEGHLIGGRPPKHDGLRLVALAELAAVAGVAVVGRLLSRRLRRRIG